MLSLYLHIPWCVRKCPYCDFNSHAGTPQEQRYVDALARDLDYELSLRPRWPRLGSIFIGGGTPSLFSGEAIGQILQIVGARLTLDQRTEITLEANPGTADAAHFAGYRAAGVNRLSIGAQSFNNSHLQALGRIHQADSIVRAFAMARAAGFDNINLDLMHSLPGQSPSEAMQDLDQAIALAPEHLSWYQLTIEPNTAFAQHPPTIPDHDTQADIEELGLARLRAAGYRRYEISAFARDGYRCRHNLNYWRFGDYLGIGAGAHGKLSDDQGPQRRARLRSPARYLAAAGDDSALASCQRPSAEELISEFALNVLRINGAFTRRRFEARTGLPWSQLDRALKQAQALNLIHERPDRVDKTELGQQHLNRLLECFAQ